MKKFLKLLRKKIVLCEENIFLNMYKDNNKGLDEMKLKNELKLKKKFENMIVNLIVRLVDKINYSEEIILLYKMFF